jgi:flagellar assembly factor FliW
MPQCVSSYFGAVEYEEEAALDFPFGLLAFEQDTRFVVLEPPHTAPVVYLQSLVHPELCFITLPVLAIDPGYRLRISADDLRALELPPDRQPELNLDVVCLSIVTIPADKRATANLLAPVVVHRATRRALQAIQMDSGYSHQHPLAAREGPCS